MFHRVIPESEMSSYGMSAFEITPDTLEIIIRTFIRQGYEIISLDQMYQNLVRDNVSTKFAVFTFDDGYKDTLTYAYPIFRKYEVPFAIYVTTNYIGRKAIKWDYLAEYLISNHKEIVMETENGTLVLDCSTATKKQAASATLQNGLRDMNDERSLSIMEHFFSSYVGDVFEKTDELMLNWTQVTQLSKDPLVTVGAHSLNHYSLSRLPEPVARAEILESRSRIESHIDSDVFHFAYPYGGRSEVGRREFSIAKHSGYRTAVTSRIGSIFTEHANHLESLPRYDICSDCNEEHLNSMINGSLALVENNLRRVVTH